MYVIKAYQTRPTITLEIWKIIFSSPDLKAQVSFSHHLMSSVNFSHFDMPLKNQSTKFVKTCM